MIESVYITLIVLAFIFLPSSFFVNQDKLLQQIILLAISAIIFGALAIASANVEIITCTSSSCTKQSFFFDENLYIFGFFALISSVLTLIKSFDAFKFKENAT
ncbi:MAG: hypothetical protein IH934_04695 [Nanoarchaeota archaeon]|nr:hypothetical protein [Nanoarchaeota archaeon]